MKKIPAAISIFTVFAISLLMVLAARAETVTQIADMSATAIDIFSIEFYTDAKVLYASNLPFGTIDFSRLDDQHSYVYPQNRSEGDGKSDTGVICRSNMNIVWYLKLIAVPASSPEFPMREFLFFMGQPYNRNTEAESNGNRLYTDNQWHETPTSSTVVYTAGTQDKRNLPRGTLATFSFAIWPLDLPAGVSYNINITYTLSPSMD